jgi:hypothetical protein
MDAACRWGVGSGKLMHPSTSGHAPTSIYVRYRQTGSSTCLWYTFGGKMSDNNLEQRIKIKFCVEIGKSASEPLALLMLAYGKYAMKKSSVFEWHRRLRKGEKMCKMTQEIGTNHVALRSKIRSETNSRRFLESVRKKRPKL